MQRLLDLLCKTKYPSVLCIICVFCETQKLAVAVVSLIRSIRELKYEAGLFIRKRYIQLVNFITRTSKSQQKEVNR